MLTRTKEEDYSKISFHNGSSRKVILEKIISGGQDYSTHCLKITNKINCSAVHVRSMQRCHRVTGTHTEKIYCNVLERDDPKRTYSMSGIVVHVIDVRKQKLDTDSSLGI